MFHDESGHNARVSPSYVCDKWTQVKSDHMADVKPFSAAQHNDVLLRAYARADRLETTFARAIEPLLKQAGETAATNFTNVATNHLQPQRIGDSLAAASLATESAQMLSDATDAVDKAKKKLAEATIAGDARMVSIAQKQLERAEAALKKTVGQVQAPIPPIILDTQATQQAQQNQASQVTPDGNNFSQPSGLDYDPKAKADEALHDETVLRRHILDKLQGNLVTGIDPDVIYSSIADEVDTEKRVVAEISQEYGFHDKLRAYAEGARGWQIPGADQVLNPQQLAASIANATRPVTEQMVKTTMEEPLKNVGISWDVTNPFTAKVLSRAGAQIKGITDTTQMDVMNVVTDSYKKGLSIPQTADAIREHMANLAPARATLIARTELAGAINGGSLAATQIVSDATGQAYQKRWLTAPGARYPRHETYAGLDGQTVGLGDLFAVGDAELSYPGDQNGPPGEVCNCRCTLLYVDAPVETETGPAIETQPDVLSQATAPYGSNATDIDQPIEATTGFGDLGLPKDPILGITPFRAGEDDPLGFFSSEKAQSFEADLNATAEKYGIKITSADHVTGVWKGSTEPSYEVHALDGPGGPDDVAKMAEELRGRYDQDGVMVFTPADQLVAGMKPNTVEYHVGGVDITKAPDALAKYGFDGATTSSDHIDIVASGPDAAARARGLADELGGTMTARQGAVDFVSRPTVTGHPPLTTRGPTPEVQARLDLAANHPQLSAPAQQVEQRISQNKENLDTLQKDYGDKLPDDQVAAVDVLLNQQGEADIQAGLRAGEGGPIKLDKDAVSGGTNLHHLANSLGDDGLNVDWKHGKKEIDLDREQVVTLIDKSIQDAPPLVGPVTVYRGVPHQSLLFGKDGPTPGETYTETGYTTTSLDPKIANAYANGDIKPLTDVGDGPPALIRLTVPKGNQALWMKSVNPDERTDELLLPRAQTIVVDDATQDDKGVWHIDAHAQTPQQEAAVFFGGPGSEDRGLINVPDMVPLPTNPVVQFPETVDPFGTGAPTVTTAADVLNKFPVHGTVEQQIEAAAPWFNPAPAQPTVPVKKRPPGALG